jgi:cation diffusion facilitator family transporter
MKTKTGLEDHAIRLTIVGNVGMGLLGVGFAIYTGSEAILLDGIFSAIGFAIALVTLYVARLVRQPGNDKYPFGYAVFEPMLNLSKGLIIAIVLVFAASTAISAILEGGRTIELGAAVLYAIIAAAGCGLLAWKIHRLAGATGSPIVAVDARNWIVDGLFSVAVALGFAAVFLLEGSRYEWLVPYADPMIVLFLVLAAIPLPYSVIRENWGQIIGIAPGHEVQRRVHDIVRRVLTSIPHRNYNLRLTHIGRLLYLQLYVVVPVGDVTAEGSVSQDQLRSSLYDSVVKEFPDLAMDLVITTNPLWVERSIKPA